MPPRFIGDGKTVLLPEQDLSLHIRGHYVVALAVAVSTRGKQVLPGCSQPVIPRLLLRSVFQLNCILGAPMFDRHWLSTRIPTLAVGALVIEESPQRIFNVIVTVNLKTWLFAFFLFVVFDGASGFAGPCRLLLCQDRGR